MKRITLLNVNIGLLAIIGVIGGSIGIVETAEADDGLAGLSFIVNAKELGLGAPPGPNCYTFVDDDVQTWIDPLFLDPAFLFPGTWEQHTNGAIIHYTASAAFPGGGGIPPLLLVQEGKITPTFSNGQLRLTAFSTVFLDDGTGTVLAEFVSTGYAGFDENLCLSEVPAP